MGIANLPIGTPLNVKTSLVKLEEEEEHEEYLHKMKTMHYKKKTVGSMVYAMVATKSDLAFVVRVANRFILKPGPMP
jgi:hypothetical protein